MADTCDKKKKVSLTELFKCSSLSVSFAAPRVLLNSPLFYAQPRFKRQRRTGSAVLAGRCCPGRRNTNLVPVSKVTQSFVFGATLYPEHRAQNSLFASLISFKGILTQFLVERSVTTGEHENIKILNTHLCAFEIRQG